MPEYIDIDDVFIVGEEAYLVAHTARLNFSAAYVTPRAGEKLSIGQENIFREVW